MQKEKKEDFRLISNNAKLLAEMLSNITADSSPEDLELMRELKETCVNMKPTLTYFISSYNKTPKEACKFLIVSLRYIWGQWQNEGGSLGFKTSLPHPFPERSLKNVVRYILLKILVQRKMSANFTPSLLEFYTYNLLKISSEFFQ